MAGALGSGVGWGLGGGWLCWYRRADNLCLVDVESRCFTVVQEGEVHERRRFLQRDGLWWLHSVSCEIISRHLVCWVHKGTHPALPSSITTQLHYQPGLQPSITTQDYHTGMHPALSHWHPPSIITLASTQHYLQHNEFIALTQKRTLS